MSLGGSTTSTTELPSWAEDYMKMAMDQAQKASSVGYVPYNGPDVAALTPMQQSAFDNTNSAASAYGLSTAPTTGMPQTTTSSNGLTGYSSAPIYQDALAQLKATNPAQYEALMSYSANPQKA